MKTNILFFLVFLPVIFFSQTTGPIIDSKLNPPTDEIINHIKKRSEIWIKGQWKVVNNSYKWVKGHWTDKRVGFHYVDGNWEKKSNGWVWKEGYWREVNVKKWLNMYS